MHVKNHAKGITMKSLFIASLVVAGLAAVPAASAADIEVMTQNQYLGADIAPLVSAPPGEFLNEVSKALMQVAANKPRERIAALASEISARQPHLVGLQEVFSFSCRNLTPLDVCSMLPFAGAFNDHLALTEQELGGRYYAVAQVTNLDFTFELEDLGIEISVIDRDVILARHDVGAAPVPGPVLDLLCEEPFQSDDGCNYQIVIRLGAPTYLTVQRGFVVAQGLVNGRPYTFVNTHLETKEPISFFQAMQAYELAQVVNGLKQFGPPVIVVGDFNSSPNDPLYVPNVPGAPPPPPEAGLGDTWPLVPNPYVQLSGQLLPEPFLVDAWTLRPGNVPGLTCCQAADLLNHKSQLHERVDLIWSSEMPWKVKQARVEGDTVNTKTRPPGRGLWPSDHGAVAATLQFR